MKVIQLIVFLAISGKISARLIRSAGGSPISIEEARYFVSIRHNSEHICGGALITVKHVVTAASCVVMTNGRRYSAVTVVSGIDEKNSKGTSSSIDEVHVLDESLTRFSTIERPDIAVIALLKSIVLTSKQGVITLPHAEPRYYEEASLIAFQTEDHSSRHSHLHQVKNIMIYYSICEARTDNKFKFGMGMLCGWRREMEGLREGDVGSPLVHNEKLVGIAVAWQPRGSQYDSYTNVFEYVDFIREKTGLVELP